MEKWIKIIFGCRVVCWICAVVATINWIYWSFKFYENGLIDEHTYASLLRPIFYRDIIITVIIVLISFGLRSVSDKLKSKCDYHKHSIRED